MGSQLIWKVQHVVRCDLPKNSKYKWMFLKETAFQPYTSNKELHSADNIYPTPANVDMEESGA